MVTVPLVLEEIAEAIHGLKQLGWALDVVIVDDSDEAGLDEATIDLAKRLQIQITVHNGHRRGLVGWAEAVNRQCGSGIVNRARCKSRVAHAVAGTSQHSDCESLIALHKTVRYGIYDQCGA